MKKILLSIGVVALAAGALLAKNDGEQVLMTVDGRPVYKSEFEYLYRKNADQQVDPSTIEDYLQKFTDYQLKVADALACGYDTMQTYIDEISQHRDELAVPYMVDKDAEKELIEEAYQRYKNLRKVSHIMLPSSPMGPDVNTIILADSIRYEIEAGRLEFTDAAERFSIDRGSNQNGGSMGWMMPGRFPAPFEDAVYALQVGELSEPVNSGFGIHIIRVDEEKENPGEVKARHILKLTARKSPEEAARAKVEIDSIYTVLMNGADFATVARLESEDPGSKNNGGDLDWFGVGVMVPAFDSAAFSLPEGVISQPIETAYGWHIIEVTGHRPAKSLEEAESQMRGMVMNSDKAAIPAQRYLEKMAERYHCRLIDSNLDAVAKQINDNNGLDSTLFVTLQQTTLPMAEMDGLTVTLDKVMADLPGVYGIDGQSARELIAQVAHRIMTEKTAELAKADLVNTNPDYRNIVHEYEDGILVFNISQDKVWQKASSDREGLTEYFNQHRDQYTFDEPRFKGFVIFVANDSIDAAVKEYLGSLEPGEVDRYTLAGKLRDKFGKHVRAERVIAKKGENPITDYLAFGGPKPENRNISWSGYFAYMGEIVDQPTEPDDVRNRVISDYQTELERRWVEDLRAKYPVKLNKKVLREIEDK